MVQIAAVMHSGDAEALASALRREGYPALVRTAPNDRFLHVQVGPFATRESALAMRTRLQAKGYTPILKP
jgi:DedD protein